VSGLLDTSIYEELVNNETSRRILNLCKEPKTTDEIKKNIFFHKSNRFPSQYKQLNDVATIVGKNLNNLENVKAIEFKDGKWQTTEDGLRVLAKYFGA
jgi:hypothetical protein